MILIKHTLILISCHYVILVVCIIHKKVQLNSLVTLWFKRTLHIDSKGYFSSTFNEKRSKSFPNIVNKRWCLHFTTSLKKIIAIDFEWVNYKPTTSYKFSSVQLLSHVQHLRANGLQHSRIPCPSLTPGAYQNSCPSSQFCHPTILSSVIPFSCPQSFSASGSFPMSQLLASDGQRTAVSASASVFPTSIQDWFPLGLTGLISL